MVSRRSDKVSQNREEAWMPPVRQHRPAAVWPTAIAGLTCGWDRSSTGSWKYLLAECRRPLAYPLNLRRQQS
jgi:hypothetical protein